VLASRLMRGHSRGQLGFLRALAITDGKQRRLPLTGRKSRAGPGTKAEKEQVEGDGTVLTEGRQGYGVFGWLAGTANDVVVYPS
jgi:hypothetical protein